MSAPLRLPARQLEKLQNAKMVRVRSGSEHRYTSVWAVIVKGRVFVRSWNDKPTGWYRAFRDEPRGSIAVDETEIAVRAVPVRSERLRHAVSTAYGEKYTTKANQKWVRGFAAAKREAATLELIPAGQ